MKKIYFYFPTGKKLFGQELAASLILKFLKEKQYAFKITTIPLFEKDGEFIPTYYLKYLFKIFLIWLSFFRLLFVQKPNIYLNTGQTWFAFFREGIPFFVLSKIKKTSCVISLHGHIFTTWKNAELKAKIFTAILRRAQKVTVLGEVQKQKLLDFGLSEDKVFIIDNTCEIEMRDEGVIIENTFHILYLSNLILSKGYMEYLNALEIVANKIQNQTIKLHATLCGKIMNAKNAPQQEVLICRLLEKINASKNLKIQWVKGAYEEKKEKLFYKSDIFVFPSSYHVEAQPIVLLEAMASNCAIITSNVGEISSTVNTDCAQILENCSPEIIADSILKLINDTPLLDTQKEAGLVQFNEKFSPTIYSQNWCKIFDEL